jgi:two-component system OmpR family sensor kinase
MPHHFVRFGGRHNEETSRHGAVVSKMALTLQMAESSTHTMSGNKGSRTAVSVRDLESPPAVDAREVTPSNESNYVANLSHELRGPLTVLDLRLQQLAYDLHATGAAARNLDLIRAEVRGLCDVVNDVLLLSRADVADEAQSSGEHSVASDVIGALSILDAAAAMKLSVRGDRAIRACISPTSWRRCLMALMDNAIKHNRNNGRVVTTIGGQRRTVIIDISDSGTGVDPAVISRLFERNVYSDSDSGPDARPSFGIGLALVHETIAHFGGTVSVLATGPTGTMMRVTLPRARR